MQLTSSTEGSTSAGKFDLLDRLATRLAIWSNWVAGAGLIAMFALIIGDIIGIKLLDHPIPGGIEIVSFLGVVVIGFALGYTQIIKGHTLVDFFIHMMPLKMRAVCESIVTFLSLVVCVILVWRCADYAGILRSSGEVSMTQKLPFYPFVYALSFCFIVLSLCILVALIKAIRKVIVK